MFVLAACEVQAALQGALPLPQRVLLTLLLVLNSFQTILRHPDNCNTINLQIMVFCVTGIPVSSHGCHAVIQESAHCCTASSRNFAKPCAQHGV